jgi:hypothetical protein
MSYLFHNDKSKAEFTTELLNSVVLLANVLYPVGTIKLTTNNVNPGNYLGGTWVAWGSGRVPVGINTSDSDFNTSEKTGGAKTGSYTPAGSVGSTTLTVNQIPSHSHGLNSHTHTIPSLSGSTNDTGSHQHYQSTGTDLFSHSGIDTGQWTSRTGSSGAMALQAGNNLTQSAGSHSHTVTTNSSTTGAASGNTANQGGNGGHNHTFSGTAANINRLQPYITCYMWKRTA